MTDDDIVMGAFLYLRSQDDVVRRMASDADTMDADPYVNKHANFIARRVQLTREEAEQVCIKLRCRWRSKPA